MTIRTNPPSNTPNNQDVFVWALYLLGGADSDIDVEAIYLKCFELAPARLGWRTRPDLPDYKKASKALQSVEAKTHPGLVLRRDEYKRRLTREGVRWIETYKDILENNYSGGQVKASKAHSTYERRRNEIKSSEVWALFLGDRSQLTALELASVMNCTPASTEQTWLNRINEVQRAADVLDDVELETFAEFVRLTVLGD